MGRIWREQIRETSLGLAISIVLMEISADILLPINIFSRHFVVHGAKSGFQTSHRKQRFQSILFKRIPLGAPYTQSDYF